MLTNTVKPGREKEVQIFGVMLYYIYIWKGNFYLVHILKRGYPGS